jgi:hypothetical protein
LARWNRKFLALSGAGARPVSGIVEGLRISDLAQEGLSKCTDSIPNQCRLPSQNAAERFATTDLPGLLPTLIGLKPGNYI